MDNPNIPKVTSFLKKNILYVPNTISQATGISVNGKLIKSIVFSTDVAIIRNINADAVIAVYPFTPQLVITQAIMTASNIPVFCGVGGGVTSGRRVVNLAVHAEFQGSFGVVVNSPTPNSLIKELKKTIDIPVVVTVGSENEDIEGRLESGVDILNISGGPRTIDIVKSVRKSFANVPIIATGGPNDITISQTIAAGANAITYTPPTNSELFSPVMENYRKR